MINTNKYIVIYLLLLLLLVFTFYNLSQTNNIELFKQKKKKKKSKSSNILSVATPVVATPTIATPSVATPTVATPVVAPPTVASPTVAIPVVATPTVATPTNIVQAVTSGPIMSEKRDIEIPQGGKICIGMECIDEMDIKGFKSTSLNMSGLDTRVATLQSEVNKIPKSSRSVRSPKRK